MKKNRMNLGPITVSTREAREKLNILLSVIGSYHELESTNILRRIPLSDLKETYNKTLECINCSSNGSKVTIHPHLWERINGII